MMYSGTLALSYGPALPPPKKSRICTVWKSGIRKSSEAVSLFASYWPGAYIYGILPPGSPWR